MKKRPWLFTFFILVALGQLVVVLRPAVLHEMVMRNGRVYKFAAAPVDPYDAFAGRYIALSYLLEDGVYLIALPRPTRQMGGRWFYARLAEDADGFAAITELTEKRPDDGSYLRVRCTKAWDKTGFVLLQLPFSRYYVEEGVAPAAERVYWEAASRRDDRRPGTEAYAQVRVKNGTGVITELYLEGVPIREYLRRKDDAD